MMENQSQLYPTKSRPRNFVVNCDDFMAAIQYLKQTIDQTFDSNGKEYDYHRGMLCGIQMAEDLANEFFVIEQNNKVNLTKRT